MKEEIINTYNHIVKEYALHEENNLQMEKHYTEFISLLPPKSKILDVGCGPGQATNKFTKQGHKVIGIIENKLKNTGFKIKKYSVEQFNEEGDLFDLVSIIAIKS